MSRISTLPRLWWMTFPCLSAPAACVTTSRRTPRMWAGVWCVMRKRLECPDPASSGASARAFLHRMEAAAWRALRDQTDEHIKVAAQLADQCRVAPKGPAKGGGAHPPCGAAAPHQHPKGREICTPSVPSFPVSPTSSCERRSVRVMSETKLVVAKKTFRMRWLSWASLRSVSP